MKILNFSSIIIIILILFSSCKDSNSGNGDNINKDTKIDTTEKILNFKYDFIINKPDNAVCGDEVEINFNVTDNISLDSLVLFVNDEKIASYKESFSQIVNTDSFKVGNQKVEIKSYAGNKNNTVSNKFLLLSDIVPKQKKYKVVKTYNHDDQAYTQGLVFHNGILYESTGLETKSNLRRVKLETGEVEQSVIIPNNFFGEGITVFNDKIYQITWQDFTAYTYNLETFQLELQYTYNTEGWGITNDDSKLYMSDGSNIIHIIDPGSFSFIDQIEVYDNKQQIKYLNELEYINGLIYANVYTQDYIVVIDPKTGKVLEKVDLGGILPKALITRNTDVLNGIAYDANNDKIYVTGKNWPRLFEIKIVD